jgi:hypothetical protein
MNIRVVRVDCGGRPLHFAIKLPQREVVWADAPGFGVPADITSLRELADAAKRFEFLDPDWEASHPEFMQRDLEPRFHVP